MNARPDNLDSIRRRNAQVHPSWLEHKLPPDRRADNSITNCFIDRRDLLKAYDDMVVKNFYLAEELAGLKV